MSVRDDGQVQCDRCGGVMENGAVTEAVVASLLGDDHRVHNLHWCLARTDELDGCARRVFTERATAAYSANHDGPVTLFDPTADPAPPAEPSPPPTAKKTAPRRKTTKKKTPKESK